MDSPGLIGDSWRGVFWAYCCTGPQHNTWVADERRSTRSCQWGKYRFIHSQKPDISAHLRPFLLQQGAYAEFIAVPETQILHKPPQLPWTDAASIPEAFITGTSSSSPHHLFVLITQEQHFRRLS